MCANHKEIGIGRHYRHGHVCSLYLIQQPTRIRFALGGGRGRVSRVVDRVATLRVLLIVTFRPEFDPPWIGLPHVTAVTINRLARRHVGDMIDRVAGNKVLPAGIRQYLIERTDGIPLFVEEMIKVCVFPVSR
jgi:hypothetical protein